MNRRKKGGNNNSLKPPAQAKPPAPSVTTSTMTPATVPAMPMRVSPPLKATTAPPQNVPPPKPAHAAQKVAQQPPKLSASPPKLPVPTMPPTRTAIPAPRPGPSQKRVLTRSDRVRVVWMQFDETWVAPQQATVAQQLEQLLAVAEKNSRVKGKALEQSKDQIVNSMRREFAMAARAEWERRLEKEGLQAEDWADMTPEEMAAVEQVLSCDDVGDGPAVSTIPSPHERAVPIVAARTHVDVPHPIASHPMTSRTTQTPPPAASQKATQAQPPPSAQKGSQGQPAWSAWAAGPRHTSVTEVPEEPPKTTSAWSARPNAPIIEDVRVSPKPVPAPQPPQASQPAPRPAQPAVQAEPTVTSAAPAHGLLAYPVPISLAMVPLDSAATSDAKFVQLVDNAYVNSIKDFHDKAATVDAELARELRKPMSPAEREWTIRAHMMTMEQIARTIVENRDTIIEKERRKRGYGGDGGAPPQPPPSAPKSQTILSQPPGAFPDDGIHVSPVPEPEEEAEIEREPEPDVDEVIEIPLKGKAAKKKGKKAATNGRSTPTPSAPPSAKPAASAMKSAPVVEKPVPVVEKKPVASGWGAKVTAPLRSASPAPPVVPPATLAPINTRLAPTPSPNGRGTPVPPGMSPWEVAKAKAAGTLKPVEPQAKPPSTPNGMWAPPVARAPSNKNQYAPTRPSRLAHVTEPESPEPPSPPPMVEPTGKDYVAWFAGSSSEDEAGLSEDEADDDDDDHDSGAQAGPGGFGGILGALAGASPWALFGSESAPPQKERGRSAHPDRGRAAAATPTPAMAAAGRSGGDLGMGMGAGMSGGWAQWGADPRAGSGGYGAGPSGFGAGSAGFDAGFSGPAGLDSGFGGSARGTAGRQWQRKEEDSLEDMLELASRSLDHATGGQGKGLEEAMAMFVTAQKARETLATPVGGRSANPWGRR
ncbi:hypothetical protein DICSQDRAFT_182212 [Dichomitus squalens LYAD-421 SS1]|uniref:Uncharacterized protein n=2 Tax=Dichomitus squalens TaxID=114155 RepID=A0A4Q9ME34_9APHY|nr:uncharacterized protein DICSQDRAFT_182212 [Dichomitus squalens LYAD-421 SS1]EJF58968.1 hypothetical protein DICSQDRAFT_182212 [Dichomitus squalens LYAD-421 SS1]TBU24096.1 hypothetical protein BD311DRAFT_37661 [Dichomitus squalens]